MTTSYIDEEIYKVLRDYALRIARRGYVTAHGGNLSIRSGNVMWITRHACSLENLRPEDIVKVPVNRPSSRDVIASTETPVHREIYRRTGNLIVMHAHPPYSVALSYFVDEVTPPDSEGYHVLRSIPVVEGRPGSTELAIRVADSLTRHWAVVVRGHGVFASSKFVDHAYQILCMVEHSAEILYLKNVYESVLGIKAKTPKEF
ncbi:MAG: class II aldolase/adducin family protein [Candidatus Nezhaarchaeota archaeon]|nr:class II aldolase/adducin family protein [Candidatus Nezhaarchaeota archaeon]MCX8141708.1 class II aldolase/adducin family protein [Candidatus Nezhaarchaeota archaeon]MDW8049975.1 class II aldolase/adducin family protein [Nitrososphaerota archaeon]